MELLSDGGSEYGARVLSKLGFSICVGHFFTYRQQLQIRLDVSHLFHHFTSHSLFKLNEMFNPNSNTP